MNWISFCEMVANIELTKETFDINKDLTKLLEEAGQP